MSAFEITVTFFTDYAAETKREEKLQATALTELIRTTSAPSKEALPWLKFVRFGDKRNARSRTLEKQILLDRVPEEGGARRRIILPVEHYRRCFDYGYCLTVHKARVEFRRGDQREPSHEVWARD
jgi:hypothetical protein